MSALDKTPTNNNFLSPLNFSFSLKRAPYINFYIQRLNLPGIALGSINYENPLTTISIPGDHIIFNELEISFKVDENMANYLEIYNWMKSLGFPENSKQYADIASKSIVSGEGTKSDISILILNSAKNPKFAINIEDAFPIILSDLNFNSTDTSINYMTATTTFKYTNHTILPL